MFLFSPVDGDEDVEDVPVVVGLVDGDAVRLALAGGANAVEAEDGDGRVEVGVEDVGRGRAVQLVRGHFACRGRKRGGGQLCRCSACQMI